MMDFTQRNNAIELTGFNLSDPGSSKDYYRILGLLPHQHDSGAAWWIIDNTTGSSFVDTDGQTYTLRKRTLAELQATDEYQAWIGTLPDDPSVPKIYANITIAGGDGETPPGIPDDGSTALTFTIRLELADGTLISSIKRAWRITISKVDSLALRKRNVIDTEVKRVSFDGGIASLSYTSMTPGNFLIDERDFDVVKQGGVFFVVKLKQPIQFKVFSD